MIFFDKAEIPMGRDRRLHIDKWHLNAGEFWAIAGESAAGKSQLAHTIAGLAGSRGRLRRRAGMKRIPEDLIGSWISFDVEQQIRRRMRKDDDSEYMGRPDDGTLLENFISREGMVYLHPELIEKLSGRGVRHFSTGEFRQALIAREAARNRKLAVLDEPFEGLDVDARRRLHEQFMQWAGSENLIVLTVNRKEDIPRNISGIAFIADESVAVFDSLESALNSPLALKIFPGEEQVKQSQFLSIPKLSQEERVPEEIISIHNLSLSYNGKAVLKNINWKVMRGEAWLLTGPNGSGKTSLLNMICGNEARAFGQNIRVFGKNRESGQCIEDIKNRIGMVSAALQETVPRFSCLTEVIGSGLRDSMIVDPPLDGYELAIVDSWIQLIGLKECQLPYSRLSYGDRRLVLLARGMIKNPPLLLLDEPMQGLDDYSRRRVSELVERIIRELGTTVIFISHRSSDAPALVNRQIRLVPGVNGGASVVEILDNIHS